MRWITVTLIVIFSGLNIQAIDFAEGDNQPIFISEDIFDEPEEFIENFLDYEWYILEEATTSFERVLTLGFDEIAVVAVIEMNFDSSAHRNGFLLRDDIFDLMLANYQPATVTDNCRLNDVLLFESEGMSNNEPYIIRQYFWSDSATRLWRVDFLFPESEEDLLQTYLEDFQPDLTSCEE